jgi:uracil-DNA glycosylase family 4
MNNGVDYIRFADCARCPLNKNRPVAGRGNPNADLVLLGEAPGYWEQERRIPISGPGGELLDQTVEVAGLPPSEVWKTNAVLCRSKNAHGDDVEPPMAAIMACRPRLLAELQAVNPKVITALGSGAVRTVFGGRFSLEEVQGVVEYKEGFPAPVLPTYSQNTFHGEHIYKYDTFLAVIKRAVKIAKGEMAVPERNEAIPWKHVTKIDDLCQVLTDLHHGKAGFTLAIDVETSGVSIVDSDLLQISIGNEQRGVSIEFQTMRDHPHTIEMLANLLRDDRFTWVIHNMSFDIQRFEKFLGASPVNAVDTMALALGLTERGEHVGLKRLSREWLNAPYYEQEVHQYVGPEQNWAAVPRGVLAHYAVLDTVYTARMFPILDRLCADEGTRELAYNLLMPAQRLFAAIESHGVRVDVPYLQSLETEWSPRVDAARVALQDYARAQGFRRLVKGKARREQYSTTVEETLFVWTAPNGKIKHTKNPKTAPPDAETMAVKKPVQRSRWVYDQVEEPLNINSPKQLQEFLFDYLKLSQPPEGRKTGKEFRDHHPDHQWSVLHSDYALMNRMLNTYVRGIGEHVASDGRVHPSILLFGAVTGRLSIQNPALQTIPSERIVGEGEAAKFGSIKRGFLPTEGMEWGETDYSQLELRVGWHLSEDEMFGEAIMSGDFHRVIAAKLFGIPEDDVTDVQRHDTKRVNFGIMYGRQAYAISRQLGCSEDTAQKYIDGFFALAPKYGQWYRDRQREALTVGRSVTPFGRVRRWNLITKENKQNVLNQAVNFPVQSTASDLCLTAAIKLQEWFVDTGYGSVLFLVHDSINYEYQPEHRDVVMAKVREIMTSWPFPSVAVLDVESKYGPSWGDTRKYRYDAT